MSKYVYGWNPDRPDHRDHRYVPSVGAPEVAGQEVALDITGIPVLDQGQQGSCTGHGTAGVVMFDQKHQNRYVVIPSRAMIYYDARIPEGTTHYDSGAQVRDAVGGVAKYGVVSDAEFPYNDQVFDKAPSKKNYEDATHQEALVYERVAYPHINLAIASGFPVVFGFTVYESFEAEETLRTGIVPIPERGEKRLGGHCVWMWGYNPKYKADGNDKIPPRTKAIRNSWGNVGDNGNFYLPQWYWDNNQCSDHWVIRKVGPKS